MVSCRSGLQAAPWLQLDLDLDCVPWTRLRPQRRSLSPEPWSSALPPAGQRFCSGPSLSFAGGWSGSDEGREPSLLTIVNIHASMAEAPNSVALGKKVWLMIIVLFPQRHFRASWDGRAGWVFLRHTPIYLQGCGAILQSWREASGAAADALV